MTGAVRRQLLAEKLAEARMKAEATAQAADRLGRMAEADEAERDRLAAQVAAVRALADRLADGWLGACRYGDERPSAPPCGSTRPPRRSRRHRAERREPVSAE